eukprot:10834113-Prorocentrum_lima.AAC.1
MLKRRSGGPALPDEHWMRCGSRQQEPFARAVHVTGLIDALARGGIGVFDPSAARAVPACVRTR